MRGMLAKWVWVRAECLTDFVLFVIYTVWFDRFDTRAPLVLFVKPIYSFKKRVLHVLNVQQEQAHALKS